MKRLWYCVAWLLLLAMLFGCIGAAAEGKEPKYGGVLKIVTANESNGIGFPAGIGGNYEAVYCAPVIEPLFMYNNKTAGFDPWLGKSYVLDEEAKTLTIELNEGVRFHDGTDFNAEAVVKNYQMFKDNNATGTKVAESFEAAGDYTVVVHLTKIDSTTLMGLLVDCGEMISPATYEAGGADACYANPIGTGPFKVAEIQPGVLYKYEKNEDYWIDGLPYLDGIEVIFCNDPSTAVSIMKSGEADIYFMALPEYVIELKDLGFTIISDPAAYTTSTYGIAFNNKLEDSSTSNLLVRKAICHAIDAEALVDALGQGLYTYTNQCAIPGSIEYNDEVVGYEYNPEKARELLKEAGYENGCPVTISFQSSGEEMLTMILGYLMDAGFDCSIDIVDGAVFSSRIMTDGDSPYTSICQYPGSSVREKFKNYWGSSPRMFGGSAIDVPEEIKSLVDTITAMPNAEDAKELVAQMQKLLIDEYCLVMPMYAKTDFVLSDGNVEGADMYVNTKRQWKPALTFLTD